MFDTYKASGRFSPQFIVWLAIGLVVAAGMAFVYQLGLHYIPLIYVNFMLTLGAAFVLGVLIALVIKQGKIRNTAIAVVSLLLLASTFLMAKYGFQFQRFKSELKTEIERMSAEELSQYYKVEIEPESVAELKRQIVESYTFSEHIQLRVDTGWSLGRAGRGGAPVSGIFVYLVWLIEAGMLFYISGAATLEAVRKPFSEKMNAWADESEVLMTLPITSPEMVEKIQSAKSVQDLLEIPLPKSDQSNQFAVYTVNSIPGEEMEDAYLTVQLQTHSVNKKGENEVKTQLLVTNAILTSAQRAHLKDNAQILNEAFRAYHESLASQAQDQDDQAGSASSS
jgi:hypothetical protein